MAKFVVVRFEMIDIEHHKAHRKPVAIGALDLLCQTGFDIAAIEQAGQRIGHRYLSELAGLVFE